MNWLGKRVRHRSHSSSMAIWSDGTNAISTNALGMLLLLLLPLLSADFSRNGHFGTTAPSVCLAVGRSIGICVRSCRFSSRFLWFLPLNLLINLFLQNEFDPT